MDSDNECFYDCDEGLTSLPLSADDVASSGKDSDSTLFERPNSQTESDKVSFKNRVTPNQNKQMGEHFAGEVPTEDDCGRNAEAQVAGEGQEDTFDDFLTEAEKEERRKDSVQLKETGNAEFKLQNFIEAESMYSEGLRVCPSSFPKERSILYSNRAACREHLGRKEEAIEDCAEAIQLEPRYLKALLRRARLHEEGDKLDEALSDYKSVLEIDPSIPVARIACQRLPDQINARNERLKEEMLGNLKDLGNKILGKFGLSTDNFQLQQNKDTGSYNIQFNQNPGSS